MTRTSRVTGHAPAARPGPAWRPGRAALAPPSTQAGGTSDSESASRDSERRSFSGKLESSRLPVRVVRVRLGVRPRNKRRRAVTESEAPSHPGRTPRRRRQAKLPRCHTVTSVLRDDSRCRDWRQPELGRGAACRREELELRVPGGLGLQVECSWQGFSTRAARRPAAGRAAPGLGPALSTPALASARAAPAEGH